MRQGSASGWPALGGQTKKPYLLAQSPSGSSLGSAVAVAADLTLLAIGTETDGSITCPAVVNGIVGLKPPHGSTANNGIIPVAHSQDITGPMTRSVANAAYLLQPMQPGSVEGHCRQGSAWSDSLIMNHCCWGLVSSCSSSWDRGKRQHLPPACNSAYAKCVRLI